MVLMKGSLFFFLSLSLDLIWGGHEKAWNLVRDYFILFKIKI